MGYPISQYNTVEKLVFLMVNATGHIAGLPGLVPGVSLTVTISKNGAPFAAPAGVVTEIGSGWYQVAASAVDANTVGPLLLHATGTGADPTDETFDVQPAFAPLVPGVPGIGGPVQSRLVLTLAQVKIYLRVTSIVDDGLIASMLIASKQAADSFLGASFREKIPTITLTGVVAGDLVQVDGQTYTCVAAAPVAADREFLIGATDHDTADNLALLLNSDVEDEDGVPYGVQSATATVVGAVLTLQPETGKRPVTATGDGVRFICTRVLTDQAIPEAVGQGCLRWIAHNYEQRADGVSAIGVSGAGSVSWTAPPEALDLWQPYRVYL
jgi:hypothetical protein